MQIFAVNDLPEKKPQFMQICSGGVAFDMIPLHLSIDELNLRRSKARLSGHRHDVYHIVLYNNSRGRFSLNGVLHDAEEGLLAISSPGESHLFPPAEKGMTSYSEFTFSYLSQDGKLLKLPFHELLELHSGITLKSWRNIKKLENEDYTLAYKIIKAISEAKSSPPDLRCIRLYRNISELFGFLVNQFSGSESSDASSISTGLEMAREYIHSHYWEKIQIDRLAKIACFSKGHFQREFKRRHSLSPVEYINEYRISAAMNLLRTTSLRCTEIAEKVGFSDIFYFSKVFKKLSRKTPAEYRKCRYSSSL